MSFSHTQRQKLHISTIYRFWLFACTFPYTLNNKKRSMKAWKAFRVVGNELTAAQEKNQHHNHLLSYSKHTHNADVSLVVFLFSQFYFILHNTWTSSQSFQTPFAVCSKVPRKGITCSLHQETSVWEKVYCRMYHTALSVRILCRTIISIRTRIKSQTFWQQRFDTYLYGTQNCTSL